VWLGISGVASVVAPAEPLIAEMLIEPAGVCEAKAVVKSTDPALDAAPVTTLSAELLKFVVSLVQPVGAAVWLKNITVPVGKPGAAAEVQAVPLEVRTLPLDPGDTIIAAVDCTVASGNVIAVVTVSAIINP